jgi:hypothetical protein
MSDACTEMPDGLRARLFLHGLGLFVAALLIGWVWMFSLLGRIVLWPIPGSIDVQLPDDPRGFRMGHMEGITNGLLLMALAGGGRFILHTERMHRLLFWSALVTAWLFTIPAMLHPFFGTRGLAFGGGPFKGGLANDLLYVVGWPPVIGVHVLFVLAIVGVRRYLARR